MAYNNLPKKDVIDSIIYLNKRLQKLNTKICCEGTGGLTEVTTEDSATVTFTGTGTPSNPLTATAIGGGGGGVTSFNSRTGVVTLTSGDIDTALGYTPYDGDTNPNGYLTSVPAQTWSSIIGKPTTVSGYGITDLLSQLLTGFVTGTNSTIVDTDTILGAFQKTQGQLNSKAPIASPTFTGTVSGITKAMVGLGNVDNTADTAKPVSTAQQTALNLKANLASPTLTGAPLAPTASSGTNTTQIATTEFVQSALPQTVVASTLPSDLTPYPDGTLFIIG